MDSILTAISTMLGAFQPFKKWLLIAFAVFTLIALCGASGLTIREITIGRLGRGVRLVLGLLALTCLIVFLFVPVNPIKSAITIQGKVIQGLFPDLSLDKPEVKIDDR